ncbi:hypothetical protein HNR76_002077 [Pseudoxanthomonas broegbernensis]|nr:hypothetical protein [Pseudoxanthomonas broegbernensis]
MKKKPQHRSTHPPAGPRPIGLLHRALLPDA